MFLNQIFKVILLALKLHVVIVDTWLEHTTVVPLGRFFSANRRFVGAMANIFGNTVDKALEN